MPSGIPIGPIDPDDEDAAAKLARVIAGLDNIEAQKVDRNKMRAEVRMLEMKGFIEGLDDAQLAWLREQVGGLAVEGRDNYQTAMFHGILQGMEWARDIKVEPNPDFFKLDELIGKTHYVQPIKRASDTEVDWDPEQAIGMTSEERDRREAEARGEDPDDSGVSYDDEQMAADILDAYASEMHRLWRRNVAWFVGLYVSLALLVGSAVLVFVWMILEDWGKAAGAVTVLTALIPVVLVVLWRAEAARSKWKTAFDWQEET